MQPARRTTKSGWKTRALLCFSCTGFALGRIETTKPPLSAKLHTLMFSHVQWSTSSVYPPPEDEDEQEVEENEDEEEEDGDEDAAAALESAESLVFFLFLFLFFVLFLLF